MMLNLLHSKAIPLDSDIDNFNKQNSALPQGNSAIIQNIQKQNNWIFFVIVMATTFGIGVLVYYKHKEISQDRSSGIKKIDD